MNAVHRLRRTLPLALLLTATALCPAGVARASLPAAPQTGKAPSSPAEKAVYEVYKRIAAADVLVAAGKYADAIAPLDKALLDLVDVIKRNPGARDYAILVGPNELLASRALNLDIREIEQPGATQIVAVRLAELNEKLLRQMARIQGKDPDTNDDFILDNAIGVINSVNPPVPDADAPILEARLKLAVAQLDGVLSRSPKLKGERVRGITGSDALRDGRAKLAKIGGQAADSRVAFAAAMPDELKVVFEVFNNECERIQKGLTTGDGYIEDSRFEKYLVDPSKFLSQTEAHFRDAYSRAGKKMPADALKPFQDRLAALRKTAEENAARFRFPTNTASDPVAEAAVKGQLTRNIAGLKVLKIATADRAWQIRKNDVGIPESRFKSGHVLYQMPGEKFARCSVFIYSEEYSGGGQYAKADGASSYPGTRWQVAQ